MELEGIRTAASTEELELDEREGEEEGVDVAVWSPGARVLKW